MEGRTCMNLGKAECPGCGTEMGLTSRVKDDIGQKIQPIIPNHNPVPNNPKGASVSKPCSGSGTEIGPVQTRTITRRKTAA